MTAVTSKLRERIVDLNEIVSSRRTFEREAFCSRENFEILFLNNESSRATTDLSFARRRRHDASFIRSKSRLARSREQ